jgi:sugar phosphate isomerase/epimerase
MSHIPDTLTRRRFLQQALLGATGAALLPEMAQAQQRKAPRISYAPFQMGVQSYSLRHFKIEEALGKTRALGLKYIEVFPGHLPATDDPKVLAMYRDMFQSYGVKMLAYGVVGFSTNEKEARAQFEFAKAMGIRTLSAYPSPDSFNLLDKLVAEYKIRIAIHNHGPGDDLYDKMDKELKAITGHNVLIGACEDTGHRLRSDENPVEAITKFGKRVYGCHLKDVISGANGEKSFTEVGKGGLDTVGLLKTLKANRFDGVLALEYEEHEENPIPQMEECLTATRAALASARK